MIGGITLLHAHLHVGCRNTLGKIEFTRDLHGINVIVEPDPVDPIAFRLRELPRIRFGSVRALLVGIDGGSGVTGRIHVAFVIDIVMSQAHIWVVDAKRDRTA